MPLIPALIRMARAYQNERERLMGGGGGTGRGRAIKFPELTLEENNDYTNILRSLGEDDEFMPEGFDDMSMPKLPKAGQFNLGQEQ